MSDLISEIKAAKTASVSMSVLETETKNDALRAMAAALDSERTAILEANRKDIEENRPLVESGEMSGSMFKRLIIDDSKIDAMIAGINDVAGLEDPVWKTMSSLELDDNLTLYQMSCPIGMLGVIFESRPDVVPQIMSLCLKSGNSVAFKGGKEAKESIRALFSVLKSAAESAGVPGDAFVLMESRSDIDSILGLHDYIDLLIPRGSNSFVRYIQEHTKIPVLGHAAGICHVYVDCDCDMKMAETVTVDSKTQYPAVCNAAETLLVHSEIAGTFVPLIADALRKKNVEIRGDETVCRLVPFAVPASVSDWDTEYGDLIISVKTVDSLEEAIDFINRHSSRHTDVIITSDNRKAAVFARSVDSADVFINASSRFADGYRFGKGAEVGISTNKIHSRGPVGMEGLMIYKYVLIGNGQIVADYTGSGAKKFSHVKTGKKYPL